MKNIKNRSRASALAGGFGAAAALLLCAAPGQAQAAPLDGTVQKMAESLISKGFTAGSSYGEVWIRDFNTFMAVSCHVNDREVIKQKLLVFFQLQQPDGGIVDGFSPRGRQDPYTHYMSPLAPDYQGHKNTVETDQESSLVQAVTVYIQNTGDRSILDESVGGIPVRKRLALALKFLVDRKIAQPYGLVWGATRADWGDVQPESGWGTDLDSSTHRALCIYDNAMFLVAIHDYLEIADPARPQRAYWEGIQASVRKNVRKYLWDAKRQKFIPHVYLDGSPFPPGFDENAIYYHGGTIIAIEAGLLTKPQVLAAYKKMQDDVKRSGAGSIGLTLYPPYPDGYFHNAILTHPYTYQNGGDWTWFGARMVPLLVRCGFRAEAREALNPMLRRVVQHNGFWEWWTRDNQPAGSGDFRGSAGVLWSAITALDADQPGGKK